MGLGEPVSIQLTQLHIIASVYTRSLAIQQDGHKAMQQTFFTASESQKSSVLQLKSVLWPSYMEPGIPIQRAGWGGNFTLTPQIQENM